MPVALRFVRPSGAAKFWTAVAERSGDTAFRHVLGPKVVVLGGGVVEALADEMMSVIIQTAKDHTMPGRLKGVEIIASKLGDNAAITGPAVLARRAAK